MRAPVSFFSAGRLARLALLAPSLALAQSPPLPAFDFSGAADGAAPPAPLVYQGVAPRPAGPTLPAQQLGAQDWRAANAAVARFARGHADIVGWEAAQAQAGTGATGATGAAAPAAAAAATAAAAAAMQHSGNPAMDPAAPPQGGAHPHSMHRKGQP